MSFKKIDYIENNHESRITRLEVTIENINQTLIRIEKRFDKIDEQFIRIDNKFEALNLKIDSNFKWVLNLYTGGFLFMVSGFLGVLGLIARGFKWI